VDNQNSSQAVSPHTYLSIRSLIFILILITVGFRIIQLKADPPANFCWSGGYFADEGYWSHNARNSVLFKEARPDGWDARIVSPIFAYFQALIFRLFGVGIVQVRIIGILSGIFIALITFQFFRKQFDPSLSFLAAVLVAVNYPLLVLARQGIIDPFSTVLAWGSILLATNNRRAIVFLSGVLLTAACITKYLMIYAFLPVALVLFLMPNRYKQIPWFVLGAFSLFLAWLALDYFPNKDLLQSFSAYYSSQQSRQSWDLISLLSNLVHQPFYLYFMKSPVILFAGNLMIWFFILRWKQAGLAERACMLWVITGILFFAFWRYRPFRYYTSLIPPLAGLAASSTLRWPDIREFLQKGKRRLLLWIGLSLPILQAFFILFDQFSSNPSIPKEVGVQIFDVIIFLGVSSLVVLFLLRRIFKLKWILLVLMAGFLLSDMRNYLKWMVQPEYAAMEISQDLAERLDQAVLTGQWAPELVLENHHRAIPVWKSFVNSDDPFQKFGITHMLLWRYPLGDEVEKFQTWYPEDFRKFHPVKTYTIKDSELVLYEKTDHKE
jgi:4-amino-4-deoxy-L-arabinose transferase-like glycosyltransferase